MAGFFGLFDYTKPGPGIQKDAPQKSRIIVFFEIYLRKFWNLVKMNILFNIFNIPSIVIMFFVSRFYFQGILLDNVESDLFLRFAFGAVFMCIPLITIGPVQAGFTYIMRNYAREEHAFLWSDFKEHALKNFKQGMIITVIDVLLLIIMGIALNFYIKVNIDSILLSIPTGIIIAAFAVFTMMHIYIYQMLVTYKLTIKQLYKNALIFAIIKFLPNLGIILLCTILVVISQIYIVVGLILYMFITVSTISLILNFYAFPKLNKYIMDKDYESNKAVEQQ